MTWLTLSGTVEVSFLGQNYYNHTEPYQHIPISNAIPQPVDALIYMIGTNDGDDDIDRIQSYHGPRYCNESIQSRLIELEPTGFAAW